MSSGKFLDAQRIHNLTSYLEELHVQVRSFNCKLQSSQLTMRLFTFMHVAQPAPCASFSVCAEAKA